MAKRREIIEYLSQKLQLAAFQDTSLNGLQFEGADEVTKIAVSVDAGRSVIQKAAELKAQFLLVHHGLIWDRPFAITGPARETFQELFQHNINLYAVHLPLDAHQEVGNNFLLAKLLKLEDLQPAVPYRGSMIACLGKNKAQCTLEEMIQQLETLPGASKPMFALRHGPAIPRSVCVVSGSGADTLQRSPLDGFDTLITGEPKQFAYHFTLENKLNAVFGGHYATETVGVSAIGEELARQFGLEYVFVHEPTGI